MKRFLCIITTVLIVCPKVLAYDFSIISSDGTPRYYTINGPNTVETSSPNIDGSWSRFDQQPSGDLVIPNQVIYQNETFTVTAIGFGSFRYCSNITSVTIPSTVKYIGMWAFFDCTSLVSINFPYTPVYVEEFSFHSTGWYENQPFGQLAFLGNTLYKYKGCTRITEDYSIEIPSNTNSIAGRAFSTDSYWGPDTGTYSPLVSVSIPSCVKYIGGNAFNACKLADVNLPESLEQLGLYSFSNTNIRNITIPHKVRSITSAFMHNDSLTTVILLAEHLQDDSAMHAFSFAPFLYCPNFKKVIIGNNVTCIIDNLFHGCSRLDSIIIPNSVRTIGQQSFTGCTGLKSLTIGEGVDSISQMAFINLDSLEVLNYNAVNCTSFTNFICNTNFQLNIGPNVRRIPDSFLSGRTNFSGSITLPYGLRFIGKFAFSLTGVHGRIDIPATVDSIGSATFMNCPNVTGIICRKTIPPVMDGIMGNINLPLEVPCNSIAAYQSAPNWRYYTNIKGFDCGNSIEGIPNDENDMVDIRIYPISNHIIVEGTTDEVRVFDSVGRSIRNEALPTGVYIVKVGERPARKVVVM